MLSIACGASCALLLSLFQYFQPAAPDVKTDEKALFIYFCCFFIIIWMKNNLVQKMRTIRIKYKDTKLDSQMERIYKDCALQDWEQD